MTGRLSAIALLAAALPLFQGCVPLVATGAATGVIMAEDRRTPGIFVEDEAIENKAQFAIGNKYGDRAHVNVTSFNRMALLTGEAPDQAARQDIEKMARSVENVRSVQNELAVGPPSSLAARSKDSYITSKIKARFVDAGKFSPAHVKVVTEASIVYLLGMVTRSEAEAATQLARSTSDVVKVVRVFEFID